MYYALRRDAEGKPKISVVLLDWSVRESFHLLHYLGQQDVDRGLFEVIVVEYYSRQSEVIRQFERQVDTWVILEMPENRYYHKHLMYNVGIVLSQGDIIVICDSDAMVRETFIRTIIQAFEKDRNIVLHLDQFRNIRQDFYPFHFPSFDDVTGAGCINNAMGKTSGLVDIEDPLHSRNYGACMCAKRKDLLAIGAADEHIDYLGHICGPYDMTFRLVNMGLQEIWHEKEFLYHTWHPGQAGVENYLGPHDGKHMSTTALEAFMSGRVAPYVENEAIRLLRAGKDVPVDALKMTLVDEHRTQAWAIDRVGKRLPAKDMSGRRGYVKTYKGYRIEYDSNVYRAQALIGTAGPSAERETRGVDLESHTLENLERQIDRKVPAALKMFHLLGTFYLRLWLMLGQAKKRIASRFRPAPGGVRAETQNLTVRARYDQFRTRIACLSGLLNDLSMSLYLMGTQGLLRDERQEAVLFTDSRWSKNYLDILSWVGVIPRTRTVCLQTSEQLEEYFQGLHESGADPLIILNRELYAKHHAMPLLQKIRKKALII